MFKEHDQLLAVEDEMILWRYMDFPKFTHLLVTENIWFNRIDKFKDKFEGTYPVANKMKRKEIYRNEIQLPQEGYDIAQNFLRERLYVSCFHNNDYESAAMWSLYSKDAGVAIKTTAKRLKNCFKNEEKDIEITKVTYTDYDNDFMPERNILYLGVYKRKSFEHEKEVRCLFLDYHHKINDNGLYIKVDLEELIEEIYISPDAPSYMQPIVEELVKKFDYSIPVIKSPLYELIR